MICVVQVVKGKASADTLKASERVRYLTGFMFCDSPCPPTLVLCCLQLLEAMDLIKSEVPCSLLALPIPNASYRWVGPAFRFAGSVP